MKRRSRTPQASSNSAHEQCDDCSSTRFRPSRWRLDDLLHLMLLQVPMRCTYCKRRQHVFLPRALKSISTRSAQELTYRANRKWKEHTSRPRVQASLKTRNALPHRP